jgi:cytochrome c-type biogenesis protein CcmH/NrfG
MIHAPALKIPSMRIPKARVAVKAKLDLARQLLAEAQAQEEGQGVYIGGGALLIIVIIILLILLL